MTTAGRHENSTNSHGRRLGVYNTASLYVVLYRTGTRVVYYKEGAREAETAV